MYSSFTVEFVTFENILFYGLITPSYILFFSNVDILIFMRYVNQLFFIPNLLC